VMGEAYREIGRRLTKSHIRHLVKGTRRLMEEASVSTS